MRVLTGIYNSETADDYVVWVLEQLDDRDETIEYNDIGASAAPDGARRAAMLTTGQATRVGRKPSAVFDDDGTPDFSAGAMIDDCRPEEQFDEPPNRSAACVITENYRVKRNWLCECRRHPLLAIERDIKFVPWLRGDIGGHMSGIR